MDLPVGVLKIFLGITIVVGALECFSGYRIFKTILGLIGFLIGAALGAALANYLSGEWVVTLLAGLVGGFIGAGLLVAFYFVGVFMIGALLGGILVEMFFSLSGNIPPTLVVIIVAILTGILAVVFQKFMIIVSTSFGGAWMMVKAASFFLGGSEFPTDLASFFSSAGTYAIGILLVTLVLGLVGLIVQFRSTRSK